MSKLKSVFLPLSIVTILILYVLFWIFVAKSCSNVVDEIQKEGLKNVIEKIWIGKKEEQKNG